MKNQFFDEYFYLKKSERQGVVIFFICSLLVIFGMRYMSNQKPVIQIQIKEDKTSAIENTSSHNSQHLKPNLHNKSKELTPSKSANQKKFKFNPNTISKDSFQMLGFSKFAANNLDKFRKKGGKIKTAEDLKKIYGLDEKLLITLNDLVIIEHKSDLDENIEIQTKGSRTDTSEKKQIEKKSLNIIDINTADSMQLVSIRGIGPFYAKKIIKMREKVGGFVNPGQLAEFKVIPDSLFHAIENQLISEPQEALKINVNEADYRVLIQHPYFSENLVKVLIQYRKTHGSFNSIEQLKNIKIMTKELYNKISKHLKVE